MIASSSSDPTGSSTAARTTERAARVVDRGDAFEALYESQHDRLVRAAALMTGMSQEEYFKMMVAGGRSPDGNRFVGEKSRG